MFSFPRSQPDTLSLPVQRVKPSRPAFIRALDLLPPYSITDVKKAFRVKAARLHPDAGGDPEAFKALHIAYERALEYAEFRESRRHWLGNRIERYTTRKCVMDQIQQVGGDCRLDPMVDYLDEFGPDFTEIIREIIAIELSGPQITDDALGWINSLGPVGAEARTLVVKNADISTAGLMRLSAFESLRALDLRGTAVSRDGLAVLEKLPRVEWLHLGKTGIRYRTRRRIKRDCPRITVITKMSEQPPPDAYWDVSRRGHLER